MCAVGTPGFYTAPTDMQANPQLLSRVGPGTQNAAIVTGVSADGRFVNLRVFPDQGDAFHLQGVGFGDDEVMGSFSNLIEHTEPAEGSTASKEQDEADKRRKMTRKERLELPEKRRKEAEEKAKLAAPKAARREEEEKQHSKRGG